MSFDLVFFGGTGDLTWRKLMPALFQAFRHNKLPPGGRLLAVARDERSDAEYRAYIREKFTGVEEAKQPSDEEFARFAELLHYRRMDLSQPDDYAGLKQWLDARGADTVVLFLATSPHLFTQICAQLGAAGINGPQVRVVLEKPLGHDLASAQEINRVVRASFAEEQALRIDHYLGKPAVQNLMALRFGNALFEPLWRRESIANIQITLAESLGVGTRGDYYDGTGALRDMIQNHALQLLTMIAMEPPSTNDADAIRDEKLKVLKSLRPFTPETVGARRGARPVPRRHRGRPGRAGLSRRGEGAAGQPLRDLRRAAHRGAELALGRRALLPAHRQAAGGARVADRHQLPRGAAPDLPGHQPRQQARHQAAARRRAGAAPAGRQGRRRRAMRPRCCPRCRWTWTSTRPS